MGNVHTRSSRLGVVLFCFVPTLVSGHRFTPLNLPELDCRMLDLQLEVANLPPPPSSVKVWVCLSQVTQLLEVKEL